MALVNVETAISKTIDHLKKSDVGQGMEILSYKRNRFVSIIKQGEDQFHVIEKGYKENQFKAETEELQKLLKSICKLEFPRSRKLRLYKIEDERDIGRKRQKI